MRVRLVHRLADSSFYGPNNGAGGKIVLAHYFYMHAYIEMYHILFFPTLRSCFSIFFFKNNLLVCLGLYIPILVIRGFTLDISLRAPLEFESGWIALTGHSYLCFLLRSSCGATAIKLPHHTAAVGDGEKMRRADSCSSSNYPDSHKPQLTTTSQSCGLLHFFTRSTTRASTYTVLQRLDICLDSGFLSSVYEWDPCLTKHAIF
jgi:hypothetical protein